MQEYVKDLRRLGRCLSRTVLVDNDPFSGLLQPCNIVPMPPFYGDPFDRYHPLGSNEADISNGALGPDPYISQPQ